MSGRLRGSLEELIQSPGIHVGHSLLRLMARPAPGNRIQVRAVTSDNHSVDDLTREFLLESQEGLDRMERCLTALETRPGDAELLAEIFRSVHTIKGTTGFLGFSRLEALSHAGENLLGLLRLKRTATHGFALADAAH
jgi:HPt (histidine-containing phosphotransfer) domain-containing protein